MKDTKENKYIMYSALDFPEEPSCVNLRALRVEEFFVSFEPGFSINN